MDTQQRVMGRQQQLGLVLHWALVSSLQLRRLGLASAVLTRVAIMAAAARAPRRPAHSSALVRPSCGDRRAKKVCECVNVNIEFI